MKKYLIKFGLLGSLTFLALFVYFYKTSGKFRKSIVAALIAAGLLFSEPLKSEAKDVDAFTPQQQNTHIFRNRDFSSRAVKKPSKNNNGPGKPSSDGGDSDDGDFIPEYPKVESVEETENRIDRIDEYSSRMDESSDSEEESESNQCPKKKKKKKSVKIGTSVVTVNSDSNGNPIFTIEKNNGSKIICTYEQALAKYYHADVHGLKFPKGFDRNHARKLAPADRKVYTASTVPKEDILGFLKANVASLSSDKLKPVPGFIGSRKEGGTIYYSGNPTNANKRELHFVNEMTGEWRTTVVQSDKQFIDLTKNDFHLFPNAGH